ncbi:MAG: hypothetical protein AAF228_08550 [Pseudomonadota bacterium]
MKTPGQRLKKSRAHSGFKSARSAALHYGWPPSTYTAHESGLRGFDLQHATKYSNCFQVSTSWLMTGENPPIWLKPQPKRQNIPKAIQVSQIETTQVPLLMYDDLLDFAYGKISLQNDNLYKNVVHMVLKDNASESVIGIRIEDTLNAPNLNPMDFVVVDLEKTPVYGKRVVAVLKGYDTPIVARLQQDLYQGKMTDVLRFDNKNTKEILLDADLCIELYRIIGVVILE